MPNIIQIEDNLDLVDSKNFPHAKFPFDKLNQVQSALFNIYDKDANVIIAAATSAGKAQPLYADILTPDGFKKMGDIEIFDEVIGYKGKLTKVVGIYPQGKKEIYKVSFDDDTSTYCCEDHLWTVSNCSRNETITTSLKNIKDTLLDEEGKPQWIIPMHHPVEFNTPETDEKTFCAFFTGFLLGNQSIKHLKKSNDSRLNYETYKRIPKKFLYGSIEDRLDLLKGICERHSSLVYYWFTVNIQVESLNLANDILFLIRSLGGKAVARSCSDFYQIDFTLNRLQNAINCGPNEFDVAVDGLDSSKYITKIEFVGEDECQCIKVESEDGLYITNDFITTHNTVCAEMFCSHSIRSDKKKSIYLSPMKALTQEKLDDWTDPNHHFSDCNISMCTGDHRYESGRADELNASNIVLLTSEMLNSMSRNPNSKRSEYLKQVKTLVVDEAHLLCVPGRGDHLECGLMNFTKNNPKARIVLLSATLANTDEIAEWLSTLNNKDTYVLKSIYRPCKLEIHLEPYPLVSKTKYRQRKLSYPEIEKEKVNKVVEIIKKYDKDKFLVFVHAKRYIPILSELLKLAGINHKMHYADLDMKERNETSAKFINDPKLRVLIATSTLAWGCNTPARRVIILGVNRGFEEIPLYDINQECGRAGRPQYDPKGDAHIVLSTQEEPQWEKKLKQPVSVVSQMVEKDDMSSNKILAFHIVNEIHHKTVRTIDDIFEWYKRTLAYFQNTKIDDHMINKMLSLLKAKNVIRIADNGELSITNIGRVSSMMYFSPYDTSDFRKNFEELFEHHDKFKKGDDYSPTYDYYIVNALSKIDSHFNDITTKAEAYLVEDFKSNFFMETKKKFDNDENIKYMKTACCYWHMMRPRNERTKMINGAMSGLRGDLERQIEVLCTMDQIDANWDKVLWFKQLQNRLKHGISWKESTLHFINGIGEKKANTLYVNGVHSIQDVVKNPARVKNILKCSDQRLNAIIEDSKLVLAGIKKLF